MTAGRVIWAIWCLCWTAFWVILAFTTSGLTLLLAVPSALAILLPVGQSSTTVISINNNNG